METSEDKCQAFLDFISKNPEAYELFERFTFEVIRAGRKRFGAKAIAERVRWFTAFEEKKSPWKLNNNHTSYLARMFEIMNPQHDGFFEKRTSVADSAFMFNVRNFYKRSDAAFFANTTTPKGELHEQVRIG